jgi:hypothetical protein
MKSQNCFQLSSFPLRWLFGFLNENISEQLSLHPPGAICFKAQMKGLESHFKCGKLHEEIRPETKRKIQKKIYRSFKLHAAHLDDNCNRTRKTKALQDQSILFNEEKEQKSRKSLN